MVTHRKLRKSTKIEIKKGASPFDIKKYLTLRNGLIAIIFVILYIMFPKHFQAVFLIAIFYPLGQISVKTSKYIKNFSIEMVTSFSIFLGYLYGWQWGVFYAIPLGGYMWIQAGVQAKTFVSIACSGIAAYLGYLTYLWFPTNFLLAYFVAITLRNIIAFILFLPFNPFMNNLVYTVSDAFWNTIIMSVFLNIFYGIVMLLPG